MRTQINEASAGAADAPRSRRGWWKPVLLLAALLTVTWAAPFFGLNKALTDLRVWIQGLGALGPVVFALIYAVATVAAVPASILTLAAGAMFGSVVGVATVAVGATAGATAAFAIARWWARDAVARWLQKSERFAKLDSMTERHGAVIVAITRLVPLFPFNLLNYGFGLTRVRFATYVLWSFLCMLPGTALYVIGGDAVTHALAERRVPWGLVGALAAVLLLLAIIVQRTRRFLAAREAAEPAPDRSGQ